jgi:Ca2+-binding EF-hand superfamily protein
VQTPARTPETPQAQPPQPSPIALAQATGQRRESAETLFARMDRNGDRQLSQSEFKARFKSRNRPVVYQRLPILFRAVDTDHSGYLEAEEFEGLAMIEDAGDQAPTLTAVDTSKDARIDFREYVAMAVKLDPTKN